jgi:Capsule assembly protein Wzi
LTLRFLLSFLCFSTIHIVAAQNLAIPLGHESYDLIDRLEIKSGIVPTHHSALKPFTRGDVVNFVQQLDSLSDGNQFLKDRKDLDYLLLDNKGWSNTALKATSKTSSSSKKIYTDSTKTFYTMSEEPKSSATSRPALEDGKGIMGTFFKNEANFFEIKQPGFYLTVNPILNFQYGKQNNPDNAHFYNLRGIELQGKIDNKLYFYTNILETQAAFTENVNRRVDKLNAVPDAGLFKNYSSSTFKIKRGYDFLASQGYIGFNLSKSIGMQLGHGQNFIGDGIRSLFLSNEAPNYFYLKLNTRLWKFHYQNIFAELARTSLPNASSVVPKKYFAAHYLSYKPISNVTLSIFETVVFNRAQNQFELQYLNPIIFYRSVEHQLGSPDNVMIGLSGKWNFLNRFSLYGQFLLDEFVFKELFINNRGWWANKYGTQLGLKYINAFGLDHLDLQAEYNSVRPYTYSHFEAYGGYTHFSQPLAHPLGANFKETLLRVRYQPMPKLTIKSTFAAILYGDDKGKENWGGNPNLNYNTRQQDYDNAIGQGIKTNVNILSADVSYQILHNLFVDVRYFSRKSTASETINTYNCSFFGGGIRWNVGQKQLLF